MKLPLLLITSESGEILFHSGNVRMNDALVAALNAVCMQSPRGLVAVGKARAYVKPVQLDGKTYLFFMDFDRLCKYYGVSAAERAADGLFDISAFSSAGAAKRSLHVMTQMFADCYKETLAADGATFEVQGPGREVTVCLPPNAYALCLALMIRLTARGGRYVRLSFVYSSGCVRVFADCIGGKPLPAKEETALRVLLAEVSAAAGFAVQTTPRGIELVLTPFDEAQIGLKADLDEHYRKNFSAFAEMFR